MNNPWPEHIAPTIHEDEYFCYSCGEVHKKDNPCACEQYFRELDKAHEEHRRMGKPIYEEK